MRIGTWNLNNRVGKVTFRPEAADAILSLECDVVVLTEYFPAEHHARFAEALRAGGLKHQLVTAEGSVRANRVLLASLRPVDRAPIDLPDFDVHARTNVLAARLEGLTILGVRVPWYEGGEMPIVKRMWDWLELTAKGMREAGPSVILGDLNVSSTSKRGRGAEQFRRILAGGWQRAQPQGHSFRNARDGEQIDHLLCTEHCAITAAELVHRNRRFEFSEGDLAISDHAALVVDLSYPTEPSNAYLYELVDGQPPPPGEQEAVRKKLLELGLTEEEVKRIT